MSDIAIRAENIGKLYHIGQTVGYKTLRENLTNAATAQFRRLGHLGYQSKDAVPSNTFWALKDVSFEVKQGEAVGIIGRNGSGKSTLLKILSRITAPTEGCADIHGRVASLLEVGTGFHPELTGRENIYLNGAVLGMKKAEIARKFDDIVAFSEIEKFVDTPVKRYSSGMYVRLAFAVAAHLESEILIVDEVLAVGDAAFQKKCLGKMGDIAKGGRTVLFVSHNLAAIQRLCQIAIWLSDGQNKLCGSTEEVVRHYLGSVQLHKNNYQVEYPGDSDKPLQLIRACIEAPANRNFRTSDQFQFEIEVLTRVLIEAAYITINILDEYDNVVYWTSDINSTRFSNPITGYCLLTCKCPRHLLTPGIYSANFAVVSLGRGTIDHFEFKRVTFEIEDDSSLLAVYGIKQPGVTAIQSDWTVQYTNTERACGK